MSEKRGDERPSGGRSGADWQTTGQAPFDEREGPMTTPRPQQSGEKPQSDRPESGQAAGQKAGRKAECDNTDFGQAAGAPGGRGGTTPYGGVQRVKPRTER